MLGNDMFEKVFSLPSFTKTWHNKSYPAISPTNPSLSAKGKSIIITGGGTGIGAAIALSFAKAGATFIGLIARREDRLQASAAAILEIAPLTKVQYEIAGITDSDALDKAFKSLASSSGGKLDILVANAAYMTIPISILTADPTTWWLTLETNVKGTFNSIRSFVPLAAKSSLVINISSAAGHVPASVGGAGGLSAYVTSKIAGAKMVEYLGAEGRESGIRGVNVQPGLVETEMGKKNEGAVWMDSVDLPGDFCVWLASEEAEFLNGRYVWANWDVEELKERKGEILGGAGLLTLSLEGIKV
ncbi:related to reductase [Phialocephala subalpina]|uniref:Related to reductase n=1 Tax=Phialocephala subalpina TaxID=576137 RepID=A0A1L7WLM2_9HELO|nr:related to reductase [Phialocephala subalpina]